MIFSCEHGRLAIGDYSITGGTFCQPDRRECRRLLTEFAITLTDKCKNGLKPSFKPLIELLHIRLDTRDKA